MARFTRKLIISKFKGKSNATYPEYFQFTVYYHIIKLPEESKGIKNIVPSPDIKKSK